MSVFDDEDAIFKVLVNDEEQHALWPALLEIPEGWRETGQQGTKAECSRYISEVWPDIRPRSLKQPIDATAKGDDPASAPPA